MWRWHGEGESPRKDVSLKHTLWKTAGGLVAETGVPQYLVLERSWEK